MKRLHEILSAAAIAAVTGSACGGGGSGDDDGAASTGDTGTASATMSASSPTSPSGDDEVGSADADSVDDGPATDDGPDTSAGDSATADSGDADTGNSIVPETLCGSTPPDGAEMPPPLPAYTGGACPPIAPGMNNISSAGNGRSFLFVAPTDVQPDEVLPVVFLWHWLGGDPQDFLEKAVVQEAADQFRFVAVIPFEKGDLLFRWPFSAVDSDARMQEEFVFFDDMLACVAASYPIDNTCVASAGVSAGALFTSQLGWGRGEYLSAIMVMSGGTGGVTKPWNGSPHIMPAMVLWGGPGDVCVTLNFEETSHNLEQALSGDGHPILECVHNCGHAEPPFTAPEGLTPFAFLWQFWLDHPYWLSDGESPWSASLPEGALEWCAMGVGSATPRVGDCSSASGC
jgi:predicted esterase